MNIVLYTGSFPTFGVGTIPNEGSPSGLEMILEVDLFCKKKFNDSAKENLGRLPGIRPGETSEFFDIMRHCPNDLPFLTLNGNRDIGNHIFTEHAWKGYEKQFMDRLL